MEGGGFLELKGRREGGVQRPAEAEQRLETQLARVWVYVGMNTTWPRYRQGCEEEGIPCPAYYQHNCDQHIEEEGHHILAAAYPCETFPREIPALPIKHRNRHRQD